MSFPTKFTTTIAVDTWDAHFRWRVGDDLRDRTIDATWRRVASAVAGAKAGEWEQRFVEAFQGWRLIPDPRLLKWAGTGRTDLLLEDPQATLNLGTFVVHPLASQPYFDHEAFRHTADLAVRFLDAAALAYGRKCCAISAIGVGMMGFADALAALGWSYMSEHACEFASAVGESLAEACLGSYLQLMQERGSCPTPVATGEHGERCACGKPPCSITPRPRMTAIRSQRLIALFANDASDALDPRCETARGAAADWEVPAHAEPVDMQQLLLQQLRLRGRLQPWIDAPIDYPLVHSAPFLERGVMLACRHYANQQALPEPRFRRTRGPILGLA